MQILPLLAGIDTRVNVDAADLARNLGPVWFLAILCFAALMIFLGAMIWGVYRIGTKLMPILENFLEGIKTSTSTNSETLKTQTDLWKSMQAMHMTPGGPCNVQDLREVAHNFANAIQTIGKEIGVDVSGDCDKIHERLRTIYVPQL